MIPNVIVIAPNTLRHDQLTRLRGWLANEYPKDVIEVADNRSNGSGQFVVIPVVGTVGAGDELLPADAIVSPERLDEIRSRLNAEASATAALH